MSKRPARRAEVCLERFVQLALLGLALATTAFPAPGDFFDFGPPVNGQNRIEIWPQTRAMAPVSRLLYGKFTEHLKWNVYNGLWAQVLKNPSLESWELIGEDWTRIPEWYKSNGFATSFPGLRIPTSPGGGVAPWWLPWGGTQVVYSIADGAFNSERCQMLSASSVEGGAGIEHPVFLPLHREETYRLVFYAKGNARLRISVLSPEWQLVSTEALVESVDWQRQDLTLTFIQKAAAGTPLLFRIELAQPGEVQLDQITLFPEDHIEGFDPDVIGKLRESKLPLLRLPGGSFVNGYHWEDGIGPVERRPTRRNPYWGDFEPNHVGTDEYMALCRLVGCEPLVCVNAGDGTAREAANWVEYTNGSTATPYGALRAANGHPEPYNVRFWEIGNELDSGGAIGHCTAEEYAQRYAAFHAEMSAVDSSLLFLAIGQNVVWSAPLVQVNGSNIRSLTVHELPGNSIPAGSPPQAVYEELMAFPATLRTRLFKLGEWMKGAGLTPKIAITEAQIFTNKPSLPNNSSLAEALWLAGLINVFAREGDLVEMITHSALVNHGGGLRKQKEVVYVNPVHYTSHLYGTQSGEYATRIRVRTPYYQSPGRYLPGTLGVRVPLLDPLALVNSAGDQLTLIVINRHATQRITATIRVNDFPAVQAVKTRVLNGASYMTRNDLEHPTLVRLVAGQTRQVNGTLSYSFPAHSIVELVFTK